MKAESFASWRFRVLMNLWPCIRGTGARVRFLSADFRRAVVEVPKSWRTKNYVGTLFGGSLYGATDPMYMLMLMHVLGRDFVVWDKGATIRFKRPGKTSVRAVFELSDERLADVRKKVDAAGEATFVWTVLLQTPDGETCAEVDKELYVAKKTFYLEKQERRRLKAAS